MSLVATLVAFFVIKAVMVWPFYYWRKIKPLIIGAATSLLLAPLMMMLYHETDISFWAVYLVMIVLDVVLFEWFLQRMMWKSILISFFMNSIAIIYFFIGNG